MRPNRLLSLAVAAMALLMVAIEGCRQPSKVPPQIGITRQPPRAMNEELVENPLPPKPPSTENSETLVLPRITTTAPASQVAIAEPAKAQATPAAAPASLATATTAPAEVAPKKYGIEASRQVYEQGEIVSVLKNGMTVVVKRIPSPVVAVRGYCETGGVYEGKWLGGGLSHLLEHLVAGGSSQRRTEAENRNLLQKIGNDSNAYTTEDHTAFFINTTNEHMSDAVDLVTGWMLGALITPAEYKREYQVVQRELEKDTGEPDWVFYDLAQANRYRVSPARVPVIGYQAVIQGLSRDDVYGYYKQCYQPNNMVFSVSGDLEPEVMLRAVQKYVDDAPPGRLPSHVVEAEPTVLAPRTVVATFPKLGQAKLQLEFPSVRISDPDLYALDLLATILGGGESSIFVQELRDKRQLVTSVEVNDNTPSYVEGSFQISMELAPEKIAEATAATLEILDTVMKGGITPEQVQRAKVQMRAARVRGMQTSENVAASLATDFMTTSDPHFSDRYVKRIEQVSREDLAIAAKWYFVRDRLITTALLPAEYVGTRGFPKAEDLLRQAAPTTKPVAAATQPAVTRVVLPNGVVLLHKQIASSPIVEVKMFALGGVSDETGDNNGIGNLTMEMLPRGTKSRNARQIAEFFDSIGGTLDTGCGNNSWYWNATCLTGDFDKAMDVLGDVVANPVFDAGELSQMKQRVSAAIDSEDANWTAQAMRFFKKAYFGPMNSPYQFLPIGSKETVAKLAPDQLAQFYREHVLHAPRVLAIYGDIDLVKAQEIAAAKFGAGVSVSGEKSAPPASVDDGAVAPKPQDKPGVEIDRVEVQKTEQPLAGIFIGYDSSSVIGDPANYSIDVANTMCSGYGYPTGYLFETLRGRGLVYEVAAQNWPGRNTKLPGTFFAYAGCDPDKVNEVVDLMLENIARLQGTDADMQPDWYIRSKELITTSDALEHETPSSQASQAALDELYGLGYDYHSKFDVQIDAVKLADVREIARRRLRRCVVTICTPAPTVVSAKAGKRTYESFPPVDLTPHGVQHDANGTK